VVTFLRNDKKRAAAIFKAGKWTVATDQDTTHNLLQAAKGKPARWLWKATAVVGIGFVVLAAIAGVASCQKAATPASLGFSGSVGITSGLLNTPRYFTALTEGLLRPMAVAVRADGTVYVADSGCRCVQVYDDAGTLSYTLGPALDEGEMQYPVALAMGDDGTLFVSDLAGGRILRFKGRVFAGVVNEGEIASLVKAPVGLALLDDLLYVNDLSLHQVLVFRMTEGALVRRIGSGKGREAGALAYPNFSLPFRDGSVLVADSNNDRLQFFGADGMSKAITQGPLSVPRGLAQAPDGTILVASTTADKIEVFSPQGRYLGGFRGFIGGQEEFGLPAGLAVYKNRLYVTDRIHGQVQIGVWP